MSRCYPFPPPGYAGKCSSHEALILSIKLQKEKEKALSAREGAKAVSDREKEIKSSEKKKDKEQRKDKKRDRDERKEGKKDKEDRKKEKREKRALKKARFAAPVDSGKQNVVKQFTKVDDNVLPESKVKLQGSSCELLERSIVTEEHGQPIESQNVPCSSDSTGNSGKRKKSSSSPIGVQSNGNIIRIRLSSSKKDEPSTSGSKLQEVVSRQQTRVEKSYSQVRPCATNVKAESSVKQKDVKKAESYVEQKKDVIKAESSVKQKEDVIKAESFVKQKKDVVKAESPVKQKKDVASTSHATLQPASTDDSGLKEKTTEAVSQNEKLSSHETIQIREQLSSHDRRKQKKEAAYQNLFVEWVPPPPAVERIAAMQEDEDEDWLFGKKSEDTSTDKLRANDDVSSFGGSNIRCAASAVLQPRACFLPDAGIYALPFTVPF